MLNLGQQQWPRGHGVQKQASSLLTWSRGATGFWATGVKEAAGRAQQHSWTCCQRSICIPGSDCTPQPTSAIAPEGMATCYTYADHLQVVKGFCDKADGKDKLTALVQYLCMFISANEPGNVKKIQASVTAARKIFRIMRPLESITPVILAPGFNTKEPKPIQVINKVKAILMAMYFGADHFVWAYQIGLISDKKTGERWQKVSLYSWALGSLCTVLGESLQLASVNTKRKEGETDEEYTKRVEEVLKQSRQRAFVLVHAVIQALLAAGLLQTLPFKPRTTGFLGVVASAMNCYLLLPAYPKLLAKPKTA